MTITRLLKLATVSDKTLVQMPHAQPRVPRRRSESARRRGTDFSMKATITRHIPRLPCCQVSDLPLG
jgi:hypothetical protein